MYNNRKFGRGGKSKSKCKGTTNKKVGKDECVFLSQWGIWEEWSSSFEN